MAILPFRIFQARILVVDDDEITRRFIISNMVRAGFRALETAGDGAEALEKTYLLKPDLVILDLQMPNLDGFGYCTRIRKDPAIPRMPIIVQTMLEEREIKLRALSCGADDFLYKPLDPVELALRVRIHLERHFMLQDMRDMCLYLKMELEQRDAILEDLTKASAPQAAVHFLDKHYEVLKEMSVLFPPPTRH